MTTAGRPTFDPARGGSQRGEKSLSALSKQYSSRDLPGHTKLKYRQAGQGTSSDNRQRDFRSELEEKERSIYGDRSSKRSSASSPTSSSRSSAKKKALPAAEAAADDRDSDLSDSGGDNSSDESEDDTAELLAELNRIKKERAADEAKKEADKQQAEEKIRMENIISGNPLIGGGGSAKSDFRVKRRWDDDVVFKNCARSEPDKSQVTFINDTLRSEFHKKFMDKYIK